MRWGTMAAWLFMMLWMACPALAAPGDGDEGVFCVRGDLASEGVPVHVHVCAHGFDGGRAESRHLVEGWLPSIMDLVERAADWDRVASRLPRGEEKGIRIGFSVFPIASTDVDGPGDSSGEEWLVVSLGQSWRIPREAGCVGLRRGRRGQMTGTGVRAWKEKVAIRVGMGIRKEDVIREAGERLLEAFRKEIPELWEGRAKGRNSGECRLRADRRFRWLGGADPARGYWPQRGSTVAVRRKEGEKAVRTEGMTAAIRKALEGAGLVVVDEGAEPEFVVTWDVQEFGALEARTQGEKVELVPLPMTLVDVTVRMRRPVLWCQDAEAERLVRRGGLPSILVQERVAVVEGIPADRCVARIAHEAVPDFHDVVHEPEEPCREEDFPCM